LNDVSRTFGDLRYVNQSTYPPYNIVKLGDNEYKLEVAVAGFKPEELDISVQNGLLRIHGNKVQETEGGDGKNYIHHGLAARSFAREFAIHKDSDVSAKYDNGILEVYVSTPPPSQPAVKKVEIK
jgi:molecular chaperone IbpA